MTPLDKGMLGQHKFPIMNTKGIFVVKTFIGLQMLCFVITKEQNFQQIAVKKHFALHCSGFLLALSLLVTTNKADNHSISPKK